MRLVIAIFVAWALYSTAVGFAVMSEAGGIAAAYFDTIARVTK